MHSIPSLRLSLKRGINAIFQRTGDERFILYQGRAVSGTPGWAGVPSRPVAKFSYNTTAAGKMMRKRALVGQPGLLG